MRKTISTGVYNVYLNCLQDPNKNVMVSKHMEDQGGLVWEHLLMEEA